VVLANARAVVPVADDAATIVELAAATSAKTAAAATSTTNAPACELVTPPFVISRHAAI
jgi:hypothetical protein